VRFRLGLLSIAFILTILLLAGCDIITGAAIAPVSPGLTDEEVQRWEEQGTANVDTLEKASALAGFKVATPDYIPSGFSRQKNIIVNRLGGGLPEGLRPAHSAIIVQTFYFMKEDDSIIFFIQQTDGKMGIGGGEPAVVCGHQGEKQNLPADPRRKYTSEILILATEINGVHFSIYATLAGPLDEATIEKILCSVNPD
jgi:hypothetical protein